MSTSCHSSRPLTRAAQSWSNGGFHNIKRVVYSSKEFQPWESENRPLNQTEAGWFISQNILSLKTLSRLLWKYPIMPSLCSAVLYLSMIHLMWRQHEPVSWKYLLQNIHLNFQYFLICTNHVPLLTIWERKIINVDRLIFTRYKYLLDDKYSTNIAVH